MSGSGRRELQREHAPRTLRAGGEREPRPSISDEQRLTDRVRMQERQDRDDAVDQALTHLDAARAEIIAATDALPAGERQLARRIRELRRLIDQIQDRRGD